MMFDDLVASKPIEISAQDVAFIKALIAGDPRKAFVEDQGEALVSFFLLPTHVALFRASDGRCTSHMVMVSSIWPYGAVTSPEC
jgi:hypothetical protein